MRDAALAAAGLSVASCFPDVGGRWPSEREGCLVTGAPPQPTLPGAVAEVYDEASVTLASSTFTMDLSRIPAMVSDLLRLLAGDVDDYWRVLLPDYVAGMRIGLKVNVLNPTCATSLPVVRSLADELQAKLGVPAADILVWDRRLDELTRSNFTEEALGVPVMGTVASTADATGPGYEDDYCTLVNGKKTRLSRILTELTDVTINCPVLKSHGVSGVTAAMKNIYGVIDKPEDFHNDLNESLPALYALAPICTRFRLTVVDALIAVTLGGTSSPPDAAAKRLLAAADPVAIDAYSLALVNQIRAEKTPRPFDPVDPKYTEWIGNAEAAGLGSQAYELRTIAR